jgi:hypothetical protein
VNRALQLTPVGEELYRAADNTIAQLDAVVERTTGAGGGPMSPGVTQSRHSLIGSGAKCKEMENSRPRWATQKSYAIRQRSRPGASQEDEALDQKRGNRRCL